MLALALAFLALLLVAWRLLRPAPAKLGPGGVQSDDDSDSSQPSRAQRMLDEAFEFAHAGAQLRRNVLVMYATEYGFAREVARKAAAALADHPALRPRIVNLLHYGCVDFQRESAVLLVCSTTGDGVPPNEAEDFCSALRARTLSLPPAPGGRSPIVLGVLALGDTSYPHFCRGGIVLEELLVKSFSSKPALTRGEINQEDWDSITAWVSEYRHAVIARFPISNRTSSPATSPIATTISPADSPIPADGSAELHDTGDYLHAAILKYAQNWDLVPHVIRYSRLEPYKAQVISRKPLTRSDFTQKIGLMEQQLNSQSEAKNVIRVEFDISDSEMKYLAGDALGVIPKNNPDLAERISLAVAASGEEFVVIGTDSSSSIAMSMKKSPVRFKDALLHQLDLKSVRGELIDAIGVATDVDQERKRCEELLGRKPGTSSSGALSAAGKTYVECRDVLDVLSDFVGARLSPAELIRVMRPLTARYYSISSSPVISPNRIAITVDVLRYMSQNIEREGVASTFLNNRVSLCEDEVGIFVSKNDNFRLPEDNSRPIVMIGPGTGIAPFVAFIDERISKSATGRNILYFGCRHADQDFLYRGKLEALVTSRKLELVTAFSRDQHEKIYVQHRLVKHGADIWSLMHVNNAHFYICGDGRRMAPDVDAALTRIISEHGGMTRDAAASYLKQLGDEGRIQRDVWVP